MYFTLFHFKIKIKSYNLCYLLDYILVFKLGQFTLKLNIIEIWIIQGAEFDIFAFITCSQSMWLTG